ncbi:flagellin N-terminal helical domain-containing protein [Clostridium estertheticum]|uniref:flagellin N-terminal helical domain-containing protein n=1 Tax=Clostridium estertheticum TaxID=238834 RepID=UPI001C7CAC70|nr:flagellin [Clostridium estertheticum]MBX4269208.1 flagellin [Clostridium estertheticum]WLC79434.1 flagellin [Clostridium estertheticum]
MIINHNLGAMNANRNMGINATAANKSMEKLSSGLRINKAGDDAAGLAISEKMRGQIRGLDQSSANAQDGISMIQTAEGALSETTSIVQRLRELSVQSSSDTNNADDRVAVQKEVVQLKSEIDRIGNTTEFNTTKLIDGSIGAKKSAGADNAAVVGGAVGSNVGAKLVAAATAPATGDFAGLAANTSQTIKVDGADISFSVAKTDYTALDNGTVIDYAKLATQVQKDINVGIDAYNKANNTSISQVSVVNGASDHLEISSGTKGSTSTVSITMGTTAATQFLEKAGFAAAAAGTVTQSDTGNEGEFTEAGAGAINAISGLAATNLTSTMTIDGKNIAVNFGSAANGAGGVRATNTFKTAATGMTTTSTLASLSGKLETDLNNAIDNYNDTASSDNKVDHISVSVKDGSYVIESGSKAETSSVKFDNSKVAQLIGVANQSSSTQGGGVDFQIGANAGQTMKITVSDMRTAALGIDKIDMSTKEGAQAATSLLDTALKSVSGQRADLGAFSNRLEHTIANLGTSSENLTSAESRIRDVDMAKEMSTFSKNNILNQAAQAMLAQANQQPQQVLALLR